jgi:hypothetical protein
MENMTTNTDVVAVGRQVWIDHSDRLCPSEGDPVATDDVYAVVVLWDPDDGRAWVGWLTTIAHSSVCFSASDLEDPAFQTWLRQLPSWEDANLWQGTTYPGLHLVWRR